MTDTARTVYNYYISHFTDLPFDKQFHFASRLFLWRQDEFCQQQLDQLQAAFTANRSPAEALHTIYAESVGSPVHGSKNAAELRRPYFEKYPQLKTQVLLLFRAAFMLQMYGIDGRKELFDIIAPEQFEDIITRLLTDEETVAILSTHAINLIYLYSRIIKRDETAFDPAHFLRIGRSQYDLSDPIQVQLLIYLYTHCIIGEAKFYYRAIPDTYRSVYLEMLADLEELFDTQLRNINLDNKFEYLVCCRLLGISSRHEAAIFAEAAKSFSPDGDYLIDRYNNNPQTVNVALDNSEHRNVLLLMATQPFHPIGS